MKTVRPRLFCSSLDQFVELVGRDGIEARRWARPGTAARGPAPGRGPGRRAFSCRRKVRTDISRRCRAAGPPWRASWRRSRPSAPGDMLVYSRKGTWIFSATVWEENSAPSWNSTPQRISSARMRLAFGIAGALAEHFDAAFAGLVEADDGAQQHRLARARAAHHAQHFAAIDIQIDMVVDDLVAEAVDQAADLDDDVFLALRVFWVRRAIRSPAPRT